MIPMCKLSSSARRHSPALNLVRFRGCTLLCPALTLYSVAKKRGEMSFQPLRAFVIDVISATEASVDSEDAAVLRTAKMSSTYIREWIVKQQQNDVPSGQEPSN